MSSKLVASINYDTLIQEKKIIHTFPVPPLDGNPSVFELMVISSLITSLNPLHVLEIGTFNGLTTLHVALNTNANAKIHTLDLEEHPSANDLLYIDPEDLKFIYNTEKKNKYYKAFTEQNKIIEHYGNSLNYPFFSFGQLDFIFIDGAHSYHAVKHDTENSLKALRPGGSVLWHDYRPDCQGVFTYLNELSSTLKLFHIEGTSFVYFKKSNL